MTDVWLLAALWLGLALTAALVSIHLRIATALSEIAVGVVAHLAGMLGVVAADAVDAVHRHTIGGPEQGQRDLRLRRESVGHRRASRGR